MKFETVIKLLREFDYYKNGKESTIEFLKIIIEELERGENNV